MWYGFDPEYLVAIEGSAQLLLALRVLTVLGSVPVTFGITALVAVVLACRRRWGDIFAWLTMFVGTALTVVVLKVAVRSARPATAVLGFGDLRWSFPSGHAAFAVVTYGLLTYSLMRVCVTWGARVWVGGVGCLLVIAIAASRIALGMHYNRDVLGGLAVGAFWLSVGIGIFKRYSDQRRMFGYSPSDDQWDASA